MPMPEFNQLCNEAKREIQEIDIQQLKGMQQRNEDFEGAEAASAMFCFMKASL